MELSVLKTNRHPDQVHPLGSFVKIRADKNPEKIGSIYLTQNLPQAAQCNFAVGTVLEVGPRVKDKTPEDLNGKRVVYRRFMSEAISFLETVDERVFLIDVADIYMILEDPTIEIGVM